MAGDPSCTTFLDPEQPISKAPILLLVFCRLHTSALDTSTWTAGYVSGSLWSETKTSSVCTRVNRLSRCPNIRRLEPHRERLRHMIQQLQALFHLRPDLACHSSPLHAPVYKTSSFLALKVLLQQGDKKPTIGLVTILRLADHHIYYILGGCDSLAKSGTQQVRHRLSVVDSAVLQVSTRFQTPGGFQMLRFELDLLCLPRIQPK